MEQYYLNKSEKKPPENKDLYLDTQCTTDQLKLFVCLLIHLFI